MTAQAPTPKQTRGPRGFVILVVLAMAAVIGAIVAAQTISSGKADVAALRIDESVRARAIAEACLGMLTQYAQTFNPPDAGITDFDLLLNANNSAPATTAGATDGDDFMPGITGTRIQIGGPGNLRKWELVDVPGTGGACAVRIDDNSDDGRVPIPGTTDPLPENNLVDEVLNLDSDQSVYVTVIGLYPANASDTSACGNSGCAYAKAHGRVTLRRLVQMPNLIIPLAPAIWATGNINLGNNSDICGIGGVTAAGGTFNNNACVCGQVSTNAPPGGPDPPTTGDSCSCPNPPGCVPTSVSVGTATAAPTWIHWGNITDAAASIAFRDNESFGPAHRIPQADIFLPAPIGEGLSPDPVTHLSPTYSVVGNSAAPAPFCSFYGDQNFHIYVWDAGDANTQTTLETATEFPGHGVGPRHASIAGGPIDGNIPAHNCTASGTLHREDPVRQPCTWNDILGNVTSLTCTAAQTPCWKLVARLLVLPDQNVSLSGTAFAAGGNGLEHTDGFGDEEWHPNRSFPLPNVAGGRHFGPGANSLCGSATNNCASCSNTGTGNNTEFAVNNQSGHYHYERGANDAFHPSPAVWLIDSPGGERVHLKEMGNGASPFRATISTSGPIDYDDGPICCATCNCSNFALMSSFEVDDTFGNIDAQAVVFKANNPNIGTVLKSALDIDFNQNTRTAGDIRGRSIDFNNNAKHIGALVSYGTGALGACNTGGLCSQAHICFRNNTTVSGDVHSMSDIIGTNNETIFGNIVAKRNLCLNNNENALGNIMAGGSVNLNNNGVIVSNSTATAGAPIQANPQLTTYSEAPW